MAGFKNLLNQYKVRRNKLIKSGDDYTMVLRIADSKANKALHCYGRRSELSCSERRRVHYLRAVSEIVIALDVLHFCHYDYKNPLLEKYLKGEL